MKPSGVRSVDLLFPSLGLGVLGRLLFYGPGVGLNLALWIWAIAATWYLLGRRAGSPRPAFEGRLVLASVALGGAFAWRSTEMLQVLDSLALVLVAASLPLAAAVPQRLPGSLRVWDLATATRQLGYRLILGLAPALLDSTRSAAGESGGRRAIVVSTTRGLLLAAPPLVVFGALLAAADQGFESLTRRIVSLDITAFAQHGFVVLGLGWTAAAVVGGLLPASQHIPTPAVRRQGLGAIEVGLSLGLIDLLFLVFVLSQLHYFFGGDGLVLATGGLTLSAYARRGFFELVWVTALVLPLLLAMHATLRPSDPKAMRAFRFAAAGAVGLALIIVASALHRMALYQREYGLTELRFFACAAIVGLAFTLVWFGLTVLGARPLRFAGGAVIAWAAWLAMLHVVNPAAVVSRVNLARAAEGKSFDVKYAVELGADAVPTLQQGLNQLSPVDRDQLTRLLAQRWRYEAPTGWRRWTLANSLAVRAAVSLPGLPSPISTQ